MTNRYKIQPFVKKAMICKPKNFQIFSPLLRTASIAYSIFRCFG